MMKSEIHPPRVGLNADPVLYGVAAGLAALFPPVMAHTQAPADNEGRSEDDEDRERRDSE